MPLPYSPAPPDQELVQLRIMDAQVTLSRWESYDFAADYQHPAAAFHFSMGDEELPKREREALVEGARVRLSINGIPICDGHIDDVDSGASRSAGSSWMITGRERLALPVDAIADPTMVFKDSTTLEDFLKRLFAPFGWVADEHFEIDNAASRRATNGLRGMPMTKGGRKASPRPLKSFVLHQLKPHNHEGVYAFAKRVTDRHGLHIRCSENGDRLIVDVPNFVQPPSYQIRRNAHGTTNVLDGRVKRSFRDQAACIIADGSSGNGEYGRGRIKAYGVNPYYGVDENGFVLDEITQVLLKHPTAHQVVFTTQPSRRRAPNVPPRIVFLHDEESRTQEQLNNFIRRELSALMSKSLVASYTVEGHGQILEGDDFVPWMVDTVVDVQDDVASLHERMWVSSVSYSKSRRSGTTTHVELLRLNSIQLGVTEEAPAQVQGQATTATVTKQVPKNFSSTGWVKTNPLPDERRAAVTTAERKR